MIKITHASCLLIFIPFFSFAQIVKKWDVKVQPPDYGSAYVNDMVRDSLGNTYITGAAKNGSKLNDIFTAKILPNGTAAWIKTYDVASATDKGLKVALDKAGNVYVGGVTSPYESSVVLLKYNINGQLLWNKTYVYSVENDASLVDMVVMPSNGDIFFTASAGSNFVLTVKYNTNGVKKWEKDYTGVSWSGTFPVKLILGADKNLYTGCQVYKGSVEDVNICVLKYDTAGTLLTTINHNSSHPSYKYDKLYDFFIGNNGELCILGESGNAGNFGPVLLKYTNVGAFISQHFLGSVAYAKMTHDANMNVYVYGGTHTDSVKIMRVNPGGNTVWSRYFKGKLGTLMALLPPQIDEDNRVVFCAKDAKRDPNNSYAYLYSTFYLNKYDSLGNLTSTVLYDDTLSDFESAGAMALNKDNGSVFIAGTVQARNHKVLLLEYDKQNNIVRNEIYFPLVQDPNFEKVSKVKTDKQGNIYLAGRLDNGDSYYKEDAWIVKSSPGGQIAWQFTYNKHNGSPDYINDIAINEKGEVYAAGYADSSALIMKLDSAGRMLWKQHFKQGKGQNEARSIAIDDSGFVYVGGYCTTTQNADAMILKYASDGVLKWIIQYNDSSNFYDELFKIVVDKNGYIYGTGKTYKKVGTALQYSDYLTIKADNAGNVVWARKPGGTIKGSISTDIVVDEKMNVYVTGLSTPQGAFTVKYDSVGTKKWFNNYKVNAQKIDSAGWLLPTDSGVVVMIKEQYSNYSIETYLISYYDNGAIRWEQYYDPQATYDYEPYGAVTDSTGNLYVLIQSCSPTGFTGYHNVGMSEIGPRGDFKWDLCYETPNINHQMVGQGIARHDDGTIYMVMKVVTSSIYNITNGLKTHLVRYNNIGNVSVEKNKDIHNNTITRVYPVPADKEIVLKFSKDNAYQLLITDILGKENASFYFSGSEITINVESYAPGVYFYKVIDANGISFSGKIVVEH